MRSTPSEAERPDAERVLVVEDEPALARALEITLRARGYQVVPAATGHAALAEAARVPPDAVLLDLGLPDLDGTEVISRLRAWTAVPVLVLSGRSGSGDKIGALDAGADALGFIFAQSPRRISPREAKRIIAAVSPRAEIVGVFVNQKSKVILETAEKAGLTGVQLHGDETLEFAHELREGARAAGIKLRIYKAIAMKHFTAGGFDLALPKNLISAYLLDSGSWAKRGGTGKKFDWKQAAPLVRFVGARFDVIIAGGLNPENVAKAIRLFQPWGVDVVSGVECEPGKKDHEKVRAFVKAAKNADL